MAIFFILYNNDATIGGYIGCWGGNFGGHTQKWIVPNIDINYLLTKGMPKLLTILAYLLLKGNCKNSLMPNQLIYALNMTPLRSQLELIHSNRASYINIYHVYCSQFNVGGGLFGLRYQSLM